MLNSGGYSYTENAHPFGCCNYSARLPGCTGITVWDSDCSRPMELPPPHAKHPKPSPAPVPAAAHPHRPPAAAVVQQPQAPPPPKLTIMPAGDTPPPTTTGYAVQTNAPPAPQSASWATSAALMIVAGVIVIVVAPRILEFHAIASHALRERIAKATADFKTRRENQAHRAEFRRYGCMQTPSFEAERRKRNAGIDRFLDLANRLYVQAERFEASRFHIAWHVAHLRSRADYYVDAAQAAIDELTRIEGVWREIVAARTTHQRDSAIANVRYLLRLLNSQVEGAATTALSRLYSLRNSIDFLDLIPSEIASPARTRAAQYLRSAAGTTSINEARAALAKLRQLFKDFGVPYERMAA